MSNAPCIRFLRDYVAIPSVNPMRRTDIDPAIIGERRYAEHVREQLRAMGLDAELIGEPDRPTVLAEARTTGATETVLVESHLDTVPVDGMEIAPFDPRIEGDRLYGRGSCDTKAGMASFLEALEGVLEAGTLRRNVIISGAADEELGSAGALALVDHLSGKLPDWCIATEPTGLRVVTRHKGIVHARVCARGQAGHASAPENGRNAIATLARAIAAIDELGAALRDRADPKLGPGTVSVGVVEGGSAPNIIPDHAALLLDRRSLPGEDAESVQRELEAAFARQGLDDVDVDWCRLEKAALGTPDDHPSVRACAAALAAAGRPVEPDSAAFGTDAGVFQSGGIPGVVLGPGSIEQAHTSREWVDVREVEAAVGVFRRILEGA